MPCRHMFSKHKNDDGTVNWLKMSNRYWELPFFRRHEAETPVPTAFDLAETLVPRASDVVSGHVQAQPPLTKGFDELNVKDRYPVTPD